MGDGTEPCGTLEFTGLGVEKWPSTGAEMDRQERKLEIKLLREGWNLYEGSLESKDLCLTPSKVFEMSRAAAKVLQKRIIISLEGKMITGRTLLAESIVTITREG